MIKLIEFASKLGIGNHKGCHNSRPDQTCFSPLSQLLLDMMFFHIIFFILKVIPRSSSVSMVISQLLPRSPLRESTTSAFGRVIIISRIFPSFRNHSSSSITYRNSNASLNASSLLWVLTPPAILMAWSRLRSLSVRLRSEIIVTT